MKDIKNLKTKLKDLKVVLGHTANGRSIKEK